LNRNIRDILARLHHWHLLMLDWYQVGMAGVKPDIPAKSYTWETLPDLNREIRKKYTNTNTDLGEVQKMLNDAFAKIEKILQKHSNEEPFPQIVMLYFSGFFSFQIYSP